MCFKSKYNSAGNTDVVDEKMLKDTLDECFMAKYLGVSSDKFLS